MSGLYDTQKYERTYRILDRVEGLTPNMFTVVKKKELIEKLKETIPKLNGLLVSLESEE